MIGRVAGSGRMGDEMAGAVNVRQRKEDRHSMQTGFDIPKIAKELLAAQDSAGQIAPYSQRLKDFDLKDAYRVTAELRAMREARGERVTGRKIGFTNRTIWDQYKVYGPIWGYMYDSTLREIDPKDGVADLARFAEPLIEPEIAFRLARAPEPGMDEAALLSCIEWVAHGVEIVQSHFPGWVFAAADTVADFGLHGAYLLGPEKPVGRDRAGWLESLREFEISLSRDGVAVDRGKAEHVLGGPLSALKHLVETLAADEINPPLAAGEIITTGTVTRAFPVKAKEIWTTEVHGAPLDGLTVAFG